MSQMIISISELQTKKNTLEPLAATFKKKLDEYNSIGNRLHGMWEGEAQAEYMKKFKLDINKLIELYNLIMSFIRILQKIIELYRSMEQKSLAISSS